MTDNSSQSNTQSVALMESIGDFDPDIVQSYLKIVLGDENYAKFVQVTDYIGQEVIGPVFRKYNQHLNEQLEIIAGLSSSLPDGYSLEHHYELKMRFYSFRFITNIGTYLLTRYRNYQDEKAMDQFIVLIKILVYQGLVSKSSTAPLALVELEQLCILDDTTPSELFQKYRRKFLRLIIKAILDKMLLSDNDNGSTDSSGHGSDGSGRNGKGDSVMTYLTRALELFEIYTVTNNLIAETLTIITHLIHKEKYNRPIKQFLENLAATQKVDVFFLVRFYIQTIIVDLLLGRKLSHLDMTESLNVLAKICGKTPQELLFRQFAKIKGRLLLEFSSDEKLVKDAIYFLSKYDKPEAEQPFEDEFDDINSFIDYISPSMIGILLSMDEHFQSKAASLGDKDSLRQIASLTKLVSLLGEQQIQTTHHKILSTLVRLLRSRPKRNDNDLNLALKNLWMTFLKKLKKDLKESLVINIAVALHDLISDCPEMVAELYTELFNISQSGEPLKNLKSLFFIPNVPGFTKIHDQLTPHVNRATKVSSLEELQDCLNGALPLMKFENQKCHSIALNRIRELLRCNQELLTSRMLINLEEPLDCTISKTVESLLALASTQDAECSVLIAECLGILGAVNPTRLNHLIYGEISDDLRGSSDNKGLSDPMFIAGLIERLKNSLFSDRRSESEHANFAIQVAVVNYNLFDGKSTILGQLSKEAYQACKLCKDTNYQFKGRNPPSMNVPLFTKFKNDNRYAYKEWLELFSLMMISLLNEPKIQQVLQACAPIFKYDPKLAEYILPIVVIHIILKQPTKVEIIIREIMAVVAEDTGVSTQDLDTVYLQDVRSSLQTLHFQCANMIFCLSDATTRLERKLDEIMLLDREQAQCLRKFNASIPKEKLALLASKCRAYARALCYFDQHFFANKKFPKTEKDKQSTLKSYRSTNDDKYSTISSTTSIYSAVDDNEEVSFLGADNYYKAAATEPYWVHLQRVYIALDDPFEAAGVNKVRVSPTTMFDELTNYESSGDLEKATQFYNALLEVVDFLPDKEFLVEDALRCFSNQGDQATIYNITRTMIADYPQLKRSILPSAIEACYKLNKWDELDSKFKDDEYDALLEHPCVSQGYLLVSLCKSRKETGETLEYVRKKLMKPLSIAMMDRNAYFRGYQNLLVLHSIEDFALALGALEECQFETQHVDENTVEIFRQNLAYKLKGLFSRWNERIKLVQPTHASVEPLLAWHRSISSALARKYPFLESEINKNIGISWLTSADRAREAKAFSRATSSLARARRHLGIGSEFHEIGLELSVKYTTGNAKLIWESGRHAQAVEELEQALNKLNNHGLRRHLLARKPVVTEAGKFPNLVDWRSCKQCESFDVTERSSFAQLLILLTRYSEEAGASSPGATLSNYEECVHLGVNQEEIFLCLARYYDNLTSFYLENPQVLTYSKAERQAERLIEQNKSLTSELSQRLSQEKLDADAEEVCTKLMEQAVIAFGNSMKYGVTYLEESMPRMLNIWFDLGSWKKRYSRGVTHRIETTVRFIDSLLEPQSGIPSYYFLSALSLLLSRVVHEHSGVSKSTKDILTRLLIDYPQQVTWRLVAVINDPIADRNKAANQIISMASKNSNDSVRKTVSGVIKFSDILVKLCTNHTVYEEPDKDDDREDDSHKTSKGTRTTRDREKERLKQQALQQKRKKIKLQPGVVEVKQIEPNCPSKIKWEVLAPIQATMHAVLPTQNECNNLKDYNVFPKHRLAYLQEIQSKAKIFNSLQAPRQITMKCTNGETINILCKAGDDLRKDSRCIEFFNLLNRILRKKSQSNARFMEVTTFLVLPLKAKAGIIEMVPNLEALRAVIEKFYKISRRNPNWSLHDKMIKRQRPTDYSNEVMFKNYKEKVLPLVSPPVLQMFFLHNFPDPTAWYMARMAYVRSTAVISMGGYIIGLGDRHLDNILLDVRHGRVVHVDFNLLFHQGETLMIPEIVPFRLTHNVVAPFGPVGVKGNFKRFCEIAMQAMRDEKDAILTTLKPFIHDPCSEWTRSVKQEKDIEHDGNKTAKSRIEVVEKKLKGFPRAAKYKPSNFEMLNSYSVEYQVKNLITEAADIYNLAQMYWGWSPQI